MNLDQRQDELIEGLKYTPTLLLHVCCAPCSTWCLKKLAEHFKITLFYCNDNIFPQAEYDKRWGEIEKLCRLVNDGNDIKSIEHIKAIKCPYNHGNFEKIAVGRETQKEGGSRCFDCYKMRLEKTARYADENNFDFFCTTLSVSPYKNALWLDEIGNAAQSKAKYLPADFKKKGGYQKTIDFCAEFGLYRQHYCGCTPDKANLDS